MMEEKFAYKGVIPHLKNFRKIGLYRLGPKSANLHRFLYQMYMIIILCLSTILYTIQQMIHTYKRRDDADEVMNAMFLLLTYTDCIYKQIVFITKADKIEELLNILKGPLFNQGDPVHNELLKKRNRNAYILLRTFNCLTLSTCLLWAIFPLISYLQEKPVEFAIWLPFDAYKNPEFYIVTGYNYIQTSWLGLSNSTMDCFMTLFLAQCKTQLTILRYELENIVRKSKEEAISTSESFTKIIKREFRKMILHYEEIVKLATLCQDIFGIAVMYQFLISGWILCTSVYRMVNLDPVSLEFLSMVSYVICILMELLVFCYYGNELTYESITLIDSAYAMDWLDTPMSEQRSLLIFMERIKRPIEQMAGIIIPLSAATFVSILRSSYSFYAFLKNSN